MTHAYMSYTKRNRKFQTDTIIIQSFGLIITVFDLFFISSFPLPLPACVFVGGGSDCLWGDYSSLCEAYIFIYIYIERDNVVYWKTKRKINDDLQCN